MRRYKPSETDLVLYPARNLKTCINPQCGIKFATRSSIDAEDENPDLCLSCNRAQWSRLWNDNKPIEKSIGRDIYTHATNETVHNFNLVSDTDIGEVVPIRTDNLLRRKRAQK